MSYDNECIVTYMSSESQADAIRQIEHALLALRTGGRRHGGPRGAGRGPWGAGHDHGDGHGDSHEHADAGHDHSHGRGPWGAGRPPWGDGPPPWAGGHHGPPGLAGAARFRMLEVLESAAPETRMGISEVAAAIGVDQPRASRLVNDAAERGLVLRSADPRDARRSVIALTDAGQALLDSARASRRSAVTEALAGFTDDETQALAALLTRLAAAWPQAPR